MGASSHSGDIITQCELGFATKQGRHPIIGASSHSRTIILSYRGADWWLLIGLTLLPCLPCPAGNLLVASFRYPCTRGHWPASESDTHRCVTSFTVSPSNVLFFSPGIGAECAQPSYLLSATAILIPSLDPSLRLPKTVLTSALPIHCMFYSAICSILFFTVTRLSIYNSVQRHTNPKGTVCWFLME